MLSPDKACHEVDNDELSCPDISLVLTEPGGVEMSSRGSATQDITVHATARAGAWLVIHREAQPKLAGNNKLRGQEVESS